MRITFEETVLGAFRTREELTAQEITALLHHKHSGRVNVALGSLIVARKVQRVQGTDKYRRTANPL